MKNFTVKEISDMLNTNPETVRRWIRDGRLDAVQNSRKDGNVVSEQALTEFLRKTPKYASSATAALAGSLAASGIGALAGLSIITTTAIIGKVLSEKKSTDEIRVTPGSMQKYVMATIKDHEKHLAEKKKELLALEHEIESEEKQIEELKTSLVRIKSFAEETDLAAATEKESQKTEDKNG